MTFPVVPPLASETDLPLHEIEDHYERAITRLLAEFQNKPRLAALLAILIKPIQELEGVFWDLKIKRTLDEAEGAQLDLIGRILLEPRGPLDDEDYRAVLRVKITVLRSSGRAPELMHICEILTGNEYRLTEFFPAAILVDIFTTPLFDPRLIKRFLQQAKSAGVRIDLGFGGANTIRWSSTIGGGGYGRVASTLSGGGLGAIGSVI